VQNINKQDFGQSIHFLFSDRRKAVWIVTETMYSKTYYYWRGTSCSGSTYEKIGYHSMRTCAGRRTDTDIVVAQQEVEYTTADNKCHHCQNVTCADIRH